MVLLKKKILIIFSIFSIIFAGIGSVLMVQHNLNESAKTINYFDEELYGCPNSNRFKKIKKKK